ncbi:MAG TPA: DUF4249 domain-containing protein [Bacteroidales bacterium]|nr:DUF4249 domain-containing protein [Bacteroidales bacterium]HPF02508.1 DUF4249 domain-containing protein [Bacteroidales bacterium]HPJ59044.1 DUF4249 domain-containing protein [Bacteroidales bacterium]HPR13226.1 DUF4249 domain-containing protein [Bacteroidales bacterium]HRW84734.1 DUF4249 domain-containing protein [Bacteroidales bacterium]
MRWLIFILVILPVLTGCVTEYIPDLNEDEELLVVEGLITDRPEENYIRIYKTYPLWSKTFRTAVKNCTVWISDDNGRTDTLENRSEGVYVTDPDTFTGEPGRIYTLHFSALTGDGIHNYESLPMKMIPVPPIDTIYYERRNYVINHLPAEGCQIYFDSYDPSSQCYFYRWEYDETWEFRLPFYDTRNRVCWSSEKSSEILIKNTSLLNESRVTRFPLKLIKNPVERLTVKYSILLTQYSLNEEEYNYWEKLGNSAQLVGGLYDIIPSTIPGNIFCLEDKLEKVLGYFSVSAVTSRRFFISDNFIGRNGLYDECLSDVSEVFTSDPDTIEGIWQSFWILYDYTDSVPPSVILTNRKYCGDCTSRGSNVRPSFWDDDK